MNTAIKESYGQREISVHAGDLTETGEVFISRSPLYKRIIKFLLSVLFWALVTFVNALTPFLHLFLVPLSVAAGVYFTIKIVSGDKEVSSGKGICPHCKEEFETMTGKLSFPVKDTCTHCHRELVLKLISK